MRLAVLFLALSATAQAQIWAGGAGNARRLLGIPICATAPSTNYTLSYNGTAWCPAAAAGGGDASTNTTTSVVGEIALFGDTGGKLFKRATGSGLVKLTSGVLATATSGTDYAPATTGTAILKASSGGFANAVAGTDYLAPPSGSAILKANSGGALANATAGTDYENPLTFSAPLSRSTNTISVTGNGIGFSQLGTDVLQVASRVVSSAEILALNTTPIEIIAAPGSGKVISVVNALYEYTFVSAAYGGAVAATGLYYGSRNASLQSAAGVGGCAGAAAILGKTTNTICADNGFYAYSTTTSDLVNKNVTISNSAANPTTGGGSLKVTLLYRIINSVF